MKKGIIIICLLGLFLTAAVTSLRWRQISDVTTTLTEVNFIHGLTSAIQAQLNSKLDTVGGDARYLQVANGDTAAYYTADEVDVKLRLGADSVWFNPVNNRIYVKKISNGKTYGYYPNDSVITSNWSGLKTKLYAGYYLNEVSGGVLDLLGNNNGTNSGAVANQTGKIGAAYNFDTNTDYIRIAHTTVPSGVNRVFAMWINLDVLPSVAGRNYILLDEMNSSYSAIMGLSINTNNNVSGVTVNAAGTYIDCNTTGGLIASAGTWYHIMYVLPTATVTGKIYINGVNRTNTSAAWTGTHKTSNGNWTIGGSNGGSSAMDGRADEVYYFVGDFTDTDALNLYNSLGYPTW